MSSFDTQSSCQQLALLIAEAPNLQYIDITQKRGTERKIRVEWKSQQQQIGGDDEEEEEAGVNVVKVLDARTG